MISSTLCICSGSTAITTRELDSENIDSMSGTRASEHPTPDCTAISATATAKPPLEIS